MNEWRLAGTRRGRLGPDADLERLGAEIAALAAHLDAATARLLDLIRAFDARGGWNAGFPSCAGQQPADLASVLGANILPAPWAETAGQRPLANDAASAA